MVALADTPRVDFRAIAESLAPRSFRIDPFGIVTGYKTYQIYTGLAAKSDAELAALGLQRQDLPGVAVQAARALHTN